MTLVQTEEISSDKSKLQAYKSNKKHEDIEKE